MTAEAETGQEKANCKMSVAERLRFLSLRLHRGSLEELLHRGRGALAVRATRVRRWFRPATRPAPDVGTGLELPPLIPATGRRGSFDGIADGTDIRALWEPARLQDATQLLLKSDDFRTEAKNRVLAWLKDHPFPVGPHYASAMECALRVPVFVRCLDRCRGESARETRNLLAGIYEHGWWISKRLSLYSSLGNHTIAESVGLVFAGAVFRDERQGRKWLETGTRLLEQELGHQILPDGGPAEQSLSYHRFVLDLYWLAAGFLELNRLHDCSGWKSRLLLGEAFLEAFAVRPGEVPSIGDSDDGHAVAPGLHPVRGGGLAVPDAGDRVTTQRAGEIVCTTFRDAGYSVVRSDRGLFLTLDHGTLGMAPLYNHGHADALSITLAVKGTALIVDPGTYRYNGVPEWRRYFKGTRAHNTVWVDSEDQAVQETSFLWSKPYRAELEEQYVGEDGMRLVASHDGYRRLKRPVVHRRTVQVGPDGTTLLTDAFSGPGRHSFELHFHLHPEASVTRDDPWWRVERSGQSAWIGLLDPESSFEVRSGEESPILGWFSRAYGHKEPAPVLRYRREGACEDVGFVTAICVERPGDETLLRERQLAP